MRKDMRKPAHTIAVVLHPPSGVNTARGNTRWTGGRRPVKISDFRPPSGIKTMTGSQPVATMRHYAY
jgi:hypothetical protein